MGLAFTSYAAISFSMSAFVSSRFLRAFGPVAACTTGLGVMGTALWSLGHVPSLPSTGVSASAMILAASSLYYVGQPLYGPSIPSMLLQCVPPHRRGVVMGADGKDRVRNLLSICTLFVHIYLCLGAFNTLARVVSPILMGSLLSQRGIGRCFHLAGTCVFAGVFIALLRRWMVLRESFEK